MTQRVALTDINYVRAISSLTQQNAARKTSGRKTSLSAAHLRFVIRQPDVVGRLNTLSADPHITHTRRAAEVCGTEALGHSSYIQQQQQSQCCVQL